MAGQRDRGGTFRIPGGKMRRGEGQNCHGREAERSDLRASLACKSEGSGPRVHSSNWVWGSKDKRIDLESVNSGIPEGSACSP